MKKIIYAYLPILGFSLLACAQLPFDDRRLASEGVSLSKLTCEDLISKANNTTFSLRNLAGLKAQAKCKDYTFDQTRLSEFETKLFSAEIAAIGPKSPIQSLTDKEIQEQIPRETNVSTKSALYKELRARYKKQGKNDLYVDLTKQMYLWSLNLYKTNAKTEPHYAVFYEAAQLTAKMFWTANNSAEANKYINEAITLTTKNQNSGAELTFLKGRIFEEAKNNIDAVKQYDLTLTDLEKYKPVGLTFTSDRVRWLKSWILFKDLKFAEAEASLSALAANTTDLSEKSRALFYQSRCLKKLGKTADANKVLESILPNDFFGYYSLVTYRELGRKFPSVSSLKTEPLIKYDNSLSFVDKAQYQILVDLINYNEKALVYKFPTIVAKNLTEDANIGLFLAQKHKMYLPVFRAFSKMDNPTKLDFFLQYPLVIFPTPYGFDVAAMSNKTAVSKSMIYGIMKQESGFDEKALSGANAMGLMQVIPALAKELAVKHGVTEYQKPEDLYNPTTNIKLGSYELMNQIKKQKGQYTYVAAAYNAGPTALSRWLVERKRDDVLEFIEEIPYEETRTYVKLIARNKLFYDRVSNQDKEFTFPEDFLIKID